MTLGQKPDQLHVPRLKRIRAVHETTLQLRNAQVIDDTPHGLTSLLSHHATLIAT